MDRSHSVLPGLGFCAAFHRPGLKINVRRFQVQQFGNPPPGIHKNQDGINPRFPGIVPKLFNEFIGKPIPCGGWHWIRSQKFRIAPADHIHFQGEPVKMPPKILDGPLGGIALSATVNRFLHLKRFDLFIGLVHQG